MDRFFKWLGISMVGMLSLVLFGALATAQEVVPIIPPITETDIKAFLAALGGAQTLGSLGVVAIIVQAIMLFLKSTLGTMAGKWQLTLVMVFTFIGGIIALKATGLDWGSVMIHSSTVGAVQVLLHQVYKQFMTKPA